MAGWIGWVDGMGWDGLDMVWCTRDKAGKILEGLNGSTTKKV